MANTQCIVQFEDDRCESCGAPIELVRGQSAYPHIRCFHDRDCPERKPAFGSPAYLHR